MKALIIISLLTGSLISDSASVIDDITIALRSGNTNMVNQYFANSVDVTILDYQDFLNKVSTVKKVNAFFSDKTISGYTLIHEGKSKGKDSVYTIGNMKTDKGSYKIYMFITSQEGKHFIEEIKIES